MSNEQGLLVIDAHTSIKGEVRGCRKIEISGAFEGELNAHTVIVHAGGHCQGTINAEAAEILGHLEGEVRVKHLISIRSTGSVTGNVQYGRLALEPGGELLAEVRNVPPTLSGDFQLEVRKGGAVRVTLDDLAALDPDDAAIDLSFSISRTVHGAIALTDAPGNPVNAFTQADLAAGRVQFRHDGSNSTTAAFAVVVTDSKGATSGVPRTIAVAVS